MSHDIEAPFAAQELALMSKTCPAHLYSVPPAPVDLSCVAVHEGRTQWPWCDGVIVAEVAGVTGEFEIAVEYKRPNETVHGLLTALGQAHAYLDKGYAGSFIVVPSRYETLSDPGAYLKSILDTHTPPLHIGLATYDPPDLSSSRPFENRLTVVRPVNLGATPPPSVAGRTKRSTTQWLHARAGEWTPSLIEGYLRAVAEQENAGTESLPTLPPDLVSAIGRVAPGSDVHRYISNTAPTRDIFHDRAWRRFWFKSVFHETNRDIWSAINAGVYEPNKTPVLWRRGNGGDSYKWCADGRSIRVKLCAALSAATITHNAAWEQYAMKIREDAHSLREDIDSYIAALGFIDTDGQLTPLGMRFLFACRRSGDAHTGVPRLIFAAALLRNGNYAALIHYIFRLSEEAFAATPLRFTTLIRGHGREFNSKPYRSWLLSELANKLGVLKLGTPRAGGTRQPLLDELAMMRFCGFLPRNDYRIAVGLPFDWAQIQRALEFDLDALTV